MSGVLFFRTARRDCLALWCRVVCGNAAAWDHFTP